MSLKQKLSEWIIIEGYCATRVLIGTDPTIINNRRAFIEKTPRVYTGGNIDDCNNWKCGDKGSTEYGRDQDSRAWCDQELLKMGYEF